MLSYCEYIPWCSILYLLAGIGNNVMANSDDCIAVSNPSPDETTFHPQNDGQKVMGISGDQNFD